MRNPFFVGVTQSLMGTDLNSLRSETGAAQSFSHKVTIVRKTVLPENYCLTRY
jgi:hypothetical protein